MDKNLIFEDVLHAIDAELDGSTSHSVFVEGICFSDEWAKELETILKSGGECASVSNPVFYIVKKKNTNEIGTLVYWDGQYDFDYPFSGYELVRELNKSTSRKRTGIVNI